MDSIIWSQPCPDRPGTQIPLSGNTGSCYDQAFPRNIDNEVNTWIYLTRGTQWVNSICICIYTHIEFKLQCRPCVLVSKSQGYTYDASSRQQMVSITPGLCMHVLAYTEASLSYAIIIHKHSTLMIHKHCTLANTSYGASTDTLHYNNTYAYIILHYITSYSIYIQCCVVTHMNCHYITLHHIQYLDTLHTWIASITLHYITLHLDSTHIHYIYIYYIATHCINWHHITSNDIALHCINLTYILQTYKYIV